jgi:uncharacterized membrane protein
MAKISMKIVISSPVQKVFQFVTSPENWTKYVTSLTDIREVSSQKVERGTTFKWTYRMLGVNSNGRGHVVENIRNKEFALKMEGGFPIQEEYRFTPVDGGTELSVKIEYEAPGRLLKAVTSTKLVEKINKKEAANVLGKIKLLCEGL